MLANLSIVRKMLLIVALPALAMIVVSVTGIQSSSRLGNDIVDVDAGGRATILAARMNTNVQALNALQYQLAADPGTREAVAKGIGAETKLFTERLAAIRPLLPPERLTRVAELEQGFARYSVALGKATEAAAGSDRDALDAAVKDAANMAAALREVVRAFFREAEGHSVAVVTAARDTASSVRLIMVAAAGGGLLLGIGSAMAIARYGVARPLEASVEALAGLAAGNLDQAIPGVDRGDEIGKVATGLQTFKDNLIRQRALEAEDAARAAAERDRARQLEQLTRDFDGNVRGVLQVVGGEVRELETTSVALTGSAEQSARQAQAVAAAAVEAAASVNTVAAAAEQLAGSITEISRQVAHAHQVSQHAATQAEQADEMVRTLAGTTQRIAEITDLIDSIAHQTNMLSLNATIEASRAGDAGKGFTVVAEEVKHLATETAKATRQVGEQIKSVLSHTTNAADAVHAITTNIQNVDEISATIASAVEEQTAATAEIARNVEQASSGTAEVSSNIVGIEQAAAETGRAAANLLGLARGLSSDSGKLKSMVEGFLTSVRALG